MAAVTFKDNYVINEVICDVVSLDRFKTTSKFNDLLMDEISLLNF